MVEKPASKWASASQAESKPQLVRVGNLLERLPVALRNRLPRAQGN